jgi:hypothetical protein
MKKILLSVCGAGLVFAVGIHARANTILLDPGSSGPSLANTATTWGYDFTVGSTPLLVTALGLWDGPEDIVFHGITGSIGDGFSNQHTVGLWDNSGNLLAQAVMQIGTGDTLIGEFRYASVLIPTNPGPVILLPGQTYVLGASYVVYDSDPLKENLPFEQATFDPAVAPGHERVSTASFGFPSGVAFLGSEVGPNALFTELSNSVPEGGSPLVLLLAAIAGMLGVRRIVRI